MGVDNLILLEALEQKFRITINLENIELEEFQSLSAITSFIAAKELQK